MVGFFAVEHLLGGGSDTLVHVRLGGLRPDRVTEHLESYRLLLPTFLHDGFLHVALCAVATLQLGAVVEQFWGSRRLLLFYVVCGLGAALAAASFNPTAPVHLGSQGAVLGLAGLVVGTSWFGRSPVRERMQLLVSQQFMYAGLLVFAMAFGLPAALSSVDSWSGLGGFLCGMLLAGATPDPAEEAPRSTLVASAAAAALLVAATVWMGFDGARAMQTASLDLARSAAVQVSEKRGPNLGSVAAEMMVRFVEAGAREEGEETLARVLRRVDDASTTQLVAYHLARSEAQGEKALHGAMRVVAEHWVSLEPDDPEALNYLAWELVQGPEDTRDPARAIEVSRQSLHRLGPDDVQSRSVYLDTLAEALFQAGALAEAEEAQLKAVRLAKEAPTSFWSRVGLSPEIPLEEMTARLERIQAAAPSG